MGRHLPDPLAWQVYGQRSHRRGAGAYGHGAGHAGVRILPDGRPINPAGSEWPFDETTEMGGETSAIALVPGTSFVLTVDTGTDDHAVRIVDTSKIGPATRSPASSSSRLPITSTTASPSSPRAGPTWRRASG